MAIPETASNTSVVTAKSEINRLASLMSKGKSTEPLYDLVHAFAHDERFELESLAEALPARWFDSMLVLRLFLIDGFTLRFEHGRVYRNGIEKVVDSALKEISISLANYIINEQSYAGKGWDDYRKVVSLYSHLIMKTDQIIAANK